MKPILSRRSRVRCLSFRVVRSVSPMKTRPLVSSSSPARQCIRVDLPEPDGPMMAVKPPTANSTSTRSRATTALSPLPYVLVAATARAATAELAAGPPVAGMSRRSVIGTHCASGDGMSSAGGTLHPSPPGSTPARRRTPWARSRGCQHPLGRGCALATSEPGSARDVVAHGIDDRLVAVATPVWLYWDGAASVSPSTSRRGSRITHAGHLRCVPGVGPGAAGLAPLQATFASLLA